MGQAHARRPVRPGDRRPAQLPEGQLRRPTKEDARLLRRLPALLSGGGHALLCLNAPELSMGFLHGLAREHAPGLSFIERVANPAVFEDVDEGRGLKVAAYHVRADEMKAP